MPAITELCTLGKYSFWTHVTVLPIKNMFFFINWMSFNYTIIVWQKSSWNRFLKIFFFFKFHTSWQKVNVCLPNSQRNIWCSSTVQRKYCVKIKRKKSMHTFLWKTTHGPCRRKCCISFPYIRASPSPHHGVHLQSKQIVLELEAWADQCFHNPF